MWLKKLVAVSMIVTLLGMNTIAAMGIFAPNEKNASLSLSQPQVVLPTMTLDALPTEVQTGLYSALSWTVEGEIDSCIASGDWTGPKTQFGSQSTGRLATEGKRTYTLSCTNQAGTVTKSVSVDVKASATATVPTASSGNSTTAAPSAPVYCFGSQPCYSRKEVAAHSSPGNCWGYNGTRVMNISGFDSAFHRAKSAIGSIEVSGVCGTDLAPSLGGSVSAGGQTRNHNNSSKGNADRNMIPYFVGYFDAAKP